MSSDETTTETAEAGGEDGPSRIAGGCVLLILAAIGVLVVKSVVTAAPYVAYFVAGILCTVGAQKARARWGRKRRQDDEGEDEAEDVAPPDVAGALRRLVGECANPDRSPATAQPARPRPAARALQPTAG